MLARQSQLSLRTPPVHERIALQCAKNISKLAAALPKPRTRSGHLPVLVEVRRPEDDVIYRYQVNLPASCVDRDQQEIDADEANALSQQLRLPCLVHGHAQTQTPTQAQAQAHAHESSSLPQNVLPLDALDTEAPQLIMMQDAVHVVHSRLKHAADGQTSIREAISTFHYSAYASGASKMTRDHFMATLHDGQPSPLQFEMLWGGDQHEACDDAEEQLQPQLQQHQLHGYDEHYAAHGNEEELPSPQAAFNGCRMAAPPKPQPVRQNVYRAQQKAEQPPLKLLNGYKQPRRASKWPTEDKTIYQQKRAPSSYQAAPSQNASCPPFGPQGYKQQHLEAAVAYADAKDYSGRQQESRERANANIPTYRTEELHPLYAHLPRIETDGHHFDLQRELQLRQKLEQDLDHQKLAEQHKYQRIFSDSLLSAHVPQELQSLFHWDCCHLCHTAMRTMRNALDHYLSRTHLRRVDSWLIRYSFVKGNLSEDMLRHLRSSGPAVLHCDLCDLKLTSVIHARQHFYGRRHRLVERHISKPNGEGYYDRTGRWVRTNDKWLMCKLCDVIVTSESQLAIHMAGVRHRKRERSTSPASIAEPFDGSHVYRINANGSLAPLNPLGYYMYAGCVKQDVRKLNDLNAAYYCEVCNITLNHLKSVKQHEEGRVHRKRLERVAQ